jgi:hypothetical protein
MKWSEAREIQRNQQKQIKKLQAKYPHIIKRLEFVTMLWGLGAYLYTVLMLIYGFSGHIKHNEIYTFFPFLYLSLIIFYLGATRNKDYEYYKKVALIMKMRYQGPLILYLVAIFIILLGIIWHYSMTI